MLTSIFYEYALFVAQFLVQYDQCFQSFSYFALGKENKKQGEKQGKQWSYCMR